MKRDARTGDLFGWEPPKVAVRFVNEDLVRAATITTRICRSIKLIIDESGMSRAEIAGGMSEYLSATINKGAIDGYTSQGKSEHKISLERAEAFLHATGDPRLFADILGRHGYAVIPSRYLAAAEEAMIADEIETLTAKKQSKRREWKS